MNHFSNPFKPFCRFFYPLIVQSQRIDAVPFLTNQLERLRRALEVIKLDAIEGWSTVVYFC